MIKEAEKVLGLRPRSIVPGRQRWDIDVMVRRPGIASALEARLQQWPGVQVVQANPVTGRLLICHDGALTSEELGRGIRQAVAVILEPTSSSSEPTTPVSINRPVDRAVPRGRDRAPGSLALGAGVAGAMAVSGFVPPLVGLGMVVVATGVVVRRGWRRSNRTRLATAAPDHSTRRPVLRIVGSHKRRFYVTSFNSVLALLLYMIPPLVVGWIVVVLAKGPTASLVHIGFATAGAQVWFLAGAGAVAGAVYAAVSFTSGVLWRDLAQRVQHEWRTEMYAHVQLAELGELENERTSRVARVLTEDIDQFGRFLTAHGNYLLRVGTTLTVVVTAFLIFAPSLAWVALVPVPIIAWLSFLYQERLTPAVATSRENAAVLSSQIINNLEASATVKSFGAEYFEIDRIRRLSDASRRSNDRIDIRTTAYSETVVTCAVASMIGLYLSGGIGVLAGLLTFGAFAILTRMPPFLLFQLPQLGEAVEQYQSTTAALHRVIELRGLPEESGRNGRRLDMAMISGEIVLEQVTFAYPGRPPILQELSLRIAPRKTTGIVGATGAGKTTIAKLLLRFQDVGTGRVLLDGTDVRELNLEDLRSAIGFVGQDGFLFDGTVIDNISYGSFDAGPERVVAAARLAEADTFIEALPHRYETTVGERGVRLSGGQRQRICLARAIVKGAPILILDEATSAVDNETEAAIRHALVDFARERTVVIIAHRLSTIRRADWIYVMGEGGGIVEQGTHDELLGRSGLYAALWLQQIGEAD